MATKIANRAAMEMNTSLGRFNAVNKVNETNAVSSDTRLRKSVMAARLKMMDMPATVRTAVLRVRTRNTADNG